MTNYKIQTKLIKALAHPARLAILEALREGEQCVCHLEALLGYRQAYISQQLTALRQTGIVQMRRAGWNIYYHVQEPRIFNILQTLQELIPPAPNQQSKKTMAVKKCPCPKCNALNKNK